MSLRLSLINMGLRVFARRRLQHLTDPKAARAELERMARFSLARPRGVTIRSEPAAQAVPSLFWFTPPQAGPKVLLYFHGGGYIAGSPHSHRGLLAALARSSGVEVCVPRYRFAPEHPFPAAQDDALAAWRRLRVMGYAPGDIAVAGDSAGGGLALSLLSRLCVEGTPPAAAVVFSPWTDMTGSGASCRENAERDPLLPVGRLGELAGYALAGHDPSDPRASPLFAAYPDCPPVFFAVSDSEVLRDDSTRLFARLKAEGVTAEIHMSPDCPHAWPVFVHRLPEADATIRIAADFLIRHFGPRI
ncbi:MAG: alpha/beta hydrolase [Albidovulum sp.]